MTSKQLTGVALLFLACGPLTTPDWKKECGGHITAALSSVTLADDCGSQGAALRDAAPCFAPDQCHSLCRQTSMQLSFDSTAVATAQIEIREVRLIDAASNNVIEKLTSREPQKWEVDKYISWDEKLPGGASILSTYKLSAPTYAASLRAISFVYRVEVDVAIDGEVRTLSIEAHREPEVAT